ncbi:thioesterase II family protein [Actinokineospora cianjurensis]|uniref:Surfactin synthase thioesterase subunit n=1 Tax=Actinokineospora cianjurensis TaxID=585224 RepID=A0A421BAS8_9PSEU|nr:alpha/beta fold hydrolase [Actinokineospora cianjurensis]RLK61263.1 surfactin synthase thioesterase subunit [Actinokineospora cianjurensis]
MSTDLWLRRFHPAPQAATRLLCLPHAGGSASYFFPVSRALSPRIEVVAVQYPGRQDRRLEPCVETIAELADQIADVLPPYLDKPLTVFGHSMGASVGFELALRLQERGTAVHGLVVSGRRAPSALRDERNHELDDDGLIREIKRLDGTESQLLDDDEILRMVLPSIRADYKAAETYRRVDGPRLKARVLALTGDSDPKATLAEVDKWADHTDGGYEREVYPGGHFYLNSHVPAVLDRIRAHVGSLSTVD